MGGACQNGLLLRVSSLQDTLIFAFGEDFEKIVAIF